MAQNGPAPAKRTEVFVKVWRPALGLRAGAMTASCLFFFALGYGARLLRPLFANPKAWRMLDAAIAITMALAAKLVLES